MLHFRKQLELMRAQLLMYESGKVNNLPTKLLDFTVLTACINLLCQLLITKNAYVVPYGLLYKLMK